MWKNNQSWTYLEIQPTTIRILNRSWHWRIHSLWIPLQQVALKGWVTKLPNQVPSDHLFDLPELWHFLLLFRREVEIFMRGMAVVGGGRILRAVVKLGQGNSGLLLQSFCRSLATSPEQRGWLVPGLPSLTQSYSVDFSQSRIGVSKSVY